MGIYYDVDHAIRDKQKAQKAQQEKYQQRRKDAEKAQRAAQEAHEKRQRGDLL